MDQLQVNELIKYQGALLVINTITPITIVIIGYFIKRTIERMESRLDKHEDAIGRLVGDVQRLIGMMNPWNGTERRTDR